MDQLFSREIQGIRRQNHDGTVDSICSRCGLTIGRAFCPTALEPLEARHICQALERRKKVRIVHRTYDPIKRSQITLYPAQEEFKRFSWRVDYVQLSV